MKSKGTRAEHVKILVVIRIARAALGWSQQEFADMMGVAKSTVARIETLEIIPRADFLTQAVRLFHDAGVTINLLQHGAVSVEVRQTGLQQAQDRLGDDSMRRSDRKLIPLPAAVEPDELVPLLAPLLAQPPKPGAAVVALEVMPVKRVPARRPAKPVVSVS